MFVFLVSGFLHDLQVLLQLGVFVLEVHVGGLDGGMCTFHLQLAFGVILIGYLPLRVSFAFSLDSFNLYVSSCCMVDRFWHCALLSSSSALVSSKFTCVVFRLVLVA